MKGILFATAAMALMVGMARAEGPNALEMPRGISRPIMAGQTGVDTGSERMPLFGGTMRHDGANPVMSDTGSGAMPVWALARPIATAGK